LDRALPAIVTNWFLDGALMYSTSFAKGAVEADPTSHSPNEDHECGPGDQHE